MKNWIFKLFGLKPNKAAWTAGILAIMTASSISAAEGDLQIENGKTIFISDELKSALRTGPSQEYRISTFLTSGTHLKVLNSNEEWVEVEVVGTDKTGWVNRLNLQNTRGAQELLERKEKTIAELNAKLETSISQLTQVESSQENTMGELGSITDKFDRLNREYEKLQEISQDAIKNYEKLKNSREELAKARTELNELEIAHAILKQDNYNRGMVHALVAVIFGVIITLLVPKLKTRPKSNRW